MIVSFACLLVLVLNGYFYFIGFQKSGYRIKEGCLGVTKLLIIDSVALVISLITSIILECNAFKNSDLLCLLTLTPAIVALLVKFVRFGKIKLKFTPRLVRAICVYLALCVCLTLISVFYQRFLRVFGVISCLSLLSVVLAFCLVNPFEKINNQKYINACKQRLAKQGCKVIAVTGSAGKTSVKEMLCVLLSPLGKVYATPKSYNTPMGIVKAVNQMPADTKIFIAEYGARHKKDIDELIKIAKPDVGVLTSIVPQHLETFGNIQNIFNEKVKVLQNAQIKFAGEKSKWCGGNFPKDTMFFGESCITKHVYSTEGTKICATINGLDFDFCTSLLGSVNAENLILAIGIAMQLGVKQADILRFVTQIQPKEHRMQPILTSSGVLVIDDSFNINPIGATAALDLLKTAKGRRIVTTSGFVEQAENNAPATRLLLDKIVDCADFLVVLGSKNKKEIIQNIDGRIDYKWVANIDECKKLYSQMLKAGDTLLILADIPESYNL